LKKGYIVIDHEMCKGCGLCVEVCPKGLITVAQGLNTKGYFPAEFKGAEECTGCALCALVCPEVAIEVYRG